MAVKFLDNTGLGYFWSKIKAWCNATFAAIAHTHTSYAVKHSYTTAANAAKNWYRIANANTQQLDISKPIRAQFIVTAYNTSYDAGYYETWFVNAIVFGRQAHIIIFGGSSAPFSQARILYENTTANIDANDRPAIDLYLSYQLANGTTKVEIEEIYNSGWTFVADGQLAASTVPSGFESVASTIRNNGIDRSTTADYASYLNRQISNITAAFTLADSYLYRSRTLNCTGTFTITIPSINSGYMWCVIKNKNTSSGVITLHPSTTSVLIDGSNANITLQPMEYVCIHSAGANNYSLIADGRWKSQKADKATTLAGYGITDAKIANGTITLGSNSITPLTSHQALPTLSRTISGSGNAITDITVSNHAITATKGSTFALDSDVVHKTGNELIEGVKVFCTNEADVAGRNKVSRVVIKNDNLIKGTTTPHTIWSQLLFTDNSNNSYEATGDNVTNRIGGLQTSTASSNSNTIALIAYKYTTDVAYQAGETVADLVVGFDNNQIKYATAPSTSEDRSDDKDIITRDFIPKDTRIVHTSGSESIDGSKTFIGTVGTNNYGFIIRNMKVTRGTPASDSVYSSVCFCDSNGVEMNNNGQHGRLGSVDCVYEASGRLIERFQLFRPYQGSNLNTSISLYMETDGVTYATAPSTLNTRNWGQDILTRDWIPKDTRIIHTTGDEEIEGLKYFKSGMKITNTLDLNASSTCITNIQLTGSSPNYADFRFVLGDQRNYSTNSYSFAVIRAFPTTGIQFGTRYGSETSWLNGPNLSLESDSGNFKLTAKAGSSETARYLIGFANGTLSWNGQAVQTSSDKRVKTSLTFIPDEILDLWEKVEWGQFQYLDAIKEKGSSARLHVGLIAQQVLAAFAEKDFDACAYGILCHEVHDASPEVLDENGEVITPAKDAIDLWMARYTEALCMEAAYQRRKNKILENRISELEKRLAKLEGAI